MVSDFILLSITNYEFQISGLGGFRITNFKLSEAVISSNS